MYGLIGLLLSPAMAMGGPALTRAALCTGGLVSVPHYYYNMGYYIYGVLLVSVPHYYYIYGVLLVSVPHYYYNMGYYILEDLIYLSCYIIGGV